MGDFIVAVVPWFFLIIFVLACVGGILTGLDDHNRLQEAKRNAPPMKVQIVNDLTNSDGKPDIPFDSK